MTEGKSQYYNVSYSIVLIYDLRFSKEITNDSTQGEF